ncbi:MAG: DegT/DnrJ/EryC1/StrS family aminotransferase [Haloarculaceae archaeon]
MSDVPLAAPALGVDERERLVEVLESGALASGDVVADFETEFADYVGTEEAVATANGTTALQVALDAVGVGPGSVVVTTPFSFVATANAIRFAGGIPVFADVDPETYNLDPERVADRVEVLGDQVDAILAVHLYGLPAEMDRLREVADAYDVPLVEDAAQAHGATYDGDRVGSIGDAAAFSFYPTKNMTTGEGGMVTTDREDVAATVRRFIDHGRSDDDGYDHVELGHNFRMTNLAAAIGRAQLQKLPGFLAARRANARRLTDQLADTSVVTPVEPADCRHAYNQYTVRTDDRDRLRSDLESRGVETGVYYPTPIPHLGAYDERDPSVPTAERLAEEVVSLPVHPGLDDADVDRVADAVASSGVITRV